MAAAVREFRLWGYLLSPTVATVKINGVQAFAGNIDVVAPPPETSPPTTTPFILGEYNGDDTEDQTIHVEINVVAGSAAFSTLQVDSRKPSVPDNWQSPANELNGGLSNILINGSSPVWPASGPTFPGGTPENPDWNGWAFIIQSGDVLSYDCLALGAEWPPAP